MTKSVTDYLEEIRSLMELKGENPFKVRAFEKAAITIEALGPSEDLAERARAGTLTEIPGIGKGISQVLTEYLIEGKTTARDELLASLPEGLLELTRVPGLGPKKAMVLIEELDLKSVSELAYACRENRLLKLKGFGDKAQAKILEGAEFLLANGGQMRLSDAFPLAERLLPTLSRAANDGRHPAAGALRVSETGALRRRLETLSELDFLVETLPGEKTTKALEEKLRLAIAEEFAGGGLPLPVRFFFAESSRYGTELARTTGTKASWTALRQEKDGDAGGLRPGSAPNLSATGEKDLESVVAADEEKFFAAIDLPWIPPEMRETGEEVALARSGKLDQIVSWNGLRGCFHNHTTRSDGVATLEQMVVGAKARGMQYIGISDHSKSAFYAQGLTEAGLAEQERELRAVQEKHPDIRIFWGIESDILADGSLDYDDEVLARFDFVIASVHSRFQMDRTTMTERVLQAVRNPRTTMLGHLTGRLLLGRKEYALEIERVIRECVKYGVAIEINAHPARLDIDWRWGADLRREGCFVSVNPDAHEVDGLDDIRYGLCVARKALLPSDLVVNTRDTAGVEAWLRQ
jgi:DNA polymerase (family 10)